MKTRRWILAVIIGLMIFGSFQVAAEEQEHKHKPYVGSEAFERMKHLVGSWEGTMDMGKGPEKVTASYKVTSGGSVIVETVFEGEPQEMVTVYHDDSHRQVIMTHYCMLGNQPKLTLKSMNDHELSFDLAEDADIDVGKEPHMHAATIKFDGKDQMSQHWTEFKDGKKGKSVDMVFHRTR